MYKKQSIAILTEGTSETSQNIAIFVSELLLKNGFHTEIIYVGNKIWTTSNTHEVVDKNDFTITRNGVKISFQCAYIYSEGKITKGWLQGYLSMLKIPYVGSSPYTTMVATNKYYCKKILRDIGIPTPKALKIRKGDSYNLEKIMANLGLPCIVKPNVGTDSLHIFKAENLKELKQGIKSVLETGNEVLLEEFIEGRDMTCGVISLNGKLTATPITEIIVPQGEFYSYDVKVKRRNKKLTPAPIAADLAELCQDMSITIFKEINCEDFVRIDYVLRDDVFYFLEVNITPGLSSRSNFRLQLAAMKLELDDLLVRMIEHKLNENR